MSVTQLLSGPETLLMETEFPFTSPLITFGYWTQPALLEQWWPEESSDRRDVIVQQHGLAFNG
jgi:uncharacterized protein YndB with AHSA1/START domain